MITDNRQYLEPRKVYIPLTDKTSKIANLKVAVEDKVLTGQIIAEKFNGKTKTPVISTISGTVVGFEERLDRFGKIIDHAIIENDFKGRSIELEPLEGNVAPAMVRNRLTECGIDQLTVDGIYTDIDFSRPVKHIIINAIYTNEPFISKDYEFIKKHAEEIADGITLLGIASHAETMTLIVDKFMDEETVDNLGKATVDKGIEVIIINSKKVQAWDYKIAKKLVNETLSNDLLDNQIIYTSVFAAKVTHDAVRLGMPLTKRQIALTGDAYKVNTLYEVRIGTPLSELSEELGGYDETSNLNIHVGSFLTGYQLESDEFSITASVDSVNVSSLRIEKEEVCIKCGDCNDICPAGILPQNIMDAELRNVNLRIVDLNTHECVECGLCTYVCPSKINVLEWVRRAKRRVG
jgi:electron transport complex protein RnfC